MVVWSAIVKLLMLIDHGYLMIYMHTLLLEPAPSLSLATTEELVDCEEGKAA